MSLQEKQKINDTSFWDKRRGIIHTAKGGWIIGEAVYNQGYSMMDDLVGKKTFFQVLMLNATGRLPDKRLADWLEALFVCLSWPDARIWCNQIGSLAGTMKCTPVAAVSAGILAADSRMYGPGTQITGASFILEALRKKNIGKTAETIIKEFSPGCQGAVPTIPGFVRPLTRGDERVTAIDQVTQKLGFARGAHLGLAFEIEKVMLEKYQEGINLLGYSAAFLCDQALTARQQYRLVSAMVNSGVHACYAEAADNPPESFFPLQCEDIDFQGHAPRPVPKKI